MKSWITKILSIGLAMIIFVSSTGFVLGIHHCDKSNSNELFLFQKEYKCATEKVEKPVCCCVKHFAVKNNCCNNSFVLVKMNVESNLTHNLTKIILPILSIKDNYVALNNVYTFIENEFISKDLPPPLKLTGKQKIILFNNIKIPNILS